MLSDIGLAKLERCDRLTLTRLTDDTGTTALLVDSPEPLSFLHDVTPTLQHRVWRRLPPSVPIGPHNPISTALSELELVGDGLVAPAAAAHLLFAARVQVLFITSAAPRFSMEVYDVPAPTASGAVPMHRVGILDAAGAQAAGLGALVHAAARRARRRPGRPHHRRRGPGADAGRGAGPADAARQCRRDLHGDAVHHAASPGLLHPRPRVLPYPLGNDEHRPGLGLQGLGDDRAHLVGA